MTFSLFTARKTEINVEITAINNEIALLQQNLQKQQQFLQEIGTVEQAGESALAQAQTFLAMVRLIDPSQESVFWSAMDALKVQNQPAFPVPEETVEDSLETESLEVDAVETTESLEVEAVEITESVEPVDEDEKVSIPLTPHQVKSLEWGALKKIAEMRELQNPSGQRLTRKFVESQLAGSLTTFDVFAATGKSIDWFTDAVAS